jgi:hypothetical protein
VLDLVTDVIFVLDIVFNFRTGIISSTGALVSDASTIARVYMRGWLAVDVLSCLPITYITLLAGEESGGAASSTKTIKILRLMRLGKLLRLARLKRILDHHWENFDVHLQRLAIVKVILLLLAVAHYAACFWHFVGYPGDRAEDYDARTGTPTWMHNCITYNDSLGTRYSASLYWATTTLTAVGYGDITAETVSEQIYTVFVELCGMVGLASVVGTVSLTILSSSMDHNAQENKRKMAMIKEYLLEKRFSTPQRRTIRLYFLKQFSMKNADEDEVLKLMPPPMRRDTIKFVYADLVSEMLLFRGLNDTVTIEMLFCLRPLFVQEVIRPSNSAMSPISSLFCFRAT